MHTKLWSMTLKIINIANSSSPSQEISSVHIDKDLNFELIFIIFLLRTSACSVKQ